MFITASEIAFQLLCGHIKQQIASHSKAGHLQCWLVPFRQCFTISRAHRESIVAAESVFC